MKDFLSHLSSFDHRLKTFSWMIFFRTVWRRIVTLLSGVYVFWLTSSLESAFLNVLINFTALWIFQSFAWFISIKYKINANILLSIGYIAEFSGFLYFLISEKTLTNFYIFTFLYSIWSWFFWASSNHIEIDIIPYEKRDFAFSIFHMLRKIVQVCIPFLVFLIFLSEKYLPFSWYDFIFLLYLPITALLVYLSFRIWEIKIDEKMSFKNFKNLIKKSDKEILPVLFLSWNIPLFEFLVSLWAVYIFWNPLDLSSYKIVFWIAWLFLVWFLSVKRHPENRAEYMKISAYLMSLSLLLFAFFQNIYTLILMTIASSVFMWNISVSSFLITSQFVIDSKKYEIWTSFWLLVRTIFFLIWRLFFMILMFLIIKIFSLKWGEIIILINSLFVLNILIIYHFSKKSEKEKAIS